MDHLFLTQWLVSALWWYEMGHERTENSEKQNFSMPVSFCSQPRLNRLQNHGERSITMLKHFQVNLKIFQDYEDIWKGEMYNIFVIQTGQLPTNT